MEIASVFIVIFVCMLVILFYLYKTSELINKRRFIVIIISVLVIFTGITILHLDDGNQHTQKFRLAFLPLTTKHKQPFDQDWLLYAIPDMIAQKMMRSVGGDAVVAPVDWIYKTIVRDSLDDVKYIHKISNQIRFPNLFYGTITKISSKKFALMYSITESNHQDDQDTIYFSLDNLLFTIDTLAIKTLNYFLFDNENLAEVGFSKSTKALKIYYDGYRNFLDGDCESAIKKTGQAISLDTMFAQANVLAGRCYLSLAIKQRSESGSVAVNVSTKLNKNEPQSIEKRSESGSITLSEFDKAKQFLDKAIELDPNHDDVYRLLGEYYVYNERWSQAELMLRKAYELNPNNPFIYIPLSRLHSYRFKNIGFSDEEQLYNQAIFINPCYEEAYLILSDHYLFNNKQEQAIKVLTDFLKINPNSVPILMELGKLYIVRNEMFELMDILNRTIELAPRNSNVYYNLGILYYNIKDYKNSKRFFQRAIEIDNHLNSYLYLAYINELEGNIEKAIYYLRQRIHYKTSYEDEFAEEARKHLFKLIQIPHHYGMHKHIFLIWFPFVWAQMISVTVTVVTIEVNWTQLNLLVIIFNL
jgi:tetratricopeptide (TPR) repeat protein